MWPRRGSVASTVASARSGLGLLRPPRAPGCWDACVSYRLSRAPACCGPRARSPTWRTCGWPTSTCATWAQHQGELSSLPAAPRRPALEHYTLAEVTTGRVEWFLAKQAKVSPSQAKQTRTMLNMLFGYALRHDAIARHPVEGTSRLRRAKTRPQALSLDQRCDPRGSRKVALRAWSPRAQAGRPGPGHHRSPARHRHAPRGGARPLALRHRGRSDRDDRQGQRHRRATQRERNCAPASTQDRRLHQTHPCPRVRGRRAAATYP